MKEKTNVQRFSVRILSGLLALLGFSACGGDDGIDETCAMYGVPTAEYHLKGKVTDVTTNKGVPGIRMVFQSYWDERISDSDVVFHLFDSDTVFSGPNGTYDYQNEWVHGGKHRVVLEDVDGPDNGGEYAKQINEISFTDSEKQKLSAWRTKVEKSDLDFHIKPSPTTE